MPFRNSPNLGAVIGVLCLSLSLLSIGLVQAQEEPSDKQQPLVKNENAKQPDRTIATVNGRPITLASIEFEFRKTVGKLNLSESQTTKAKKAILDRLIDQLTVVDFLAQHDMKVGKNQIQERFDELEARLDLVDQKLADHLNQIKLSRSDLAARIEWEIAWTQYVQQKATDEQLQAHFEKNKRQFDGTKLRVAHLFLKLPDRNSTTPSKAQQEKDRAKVLEKANRIYEQIQSNQIKWYDALIEFSQAPSRDDGGEVGWIGIDGPMPRSFTQIAFGLDAGEISEPVETVFGIHIIKCIQTETGKVGWRQAIKPLKADYTRFLFDAIVTNHKPEVVIKKLHGSKF